METLSGLLERNLQQQARHPAISFGDEQVSYPELERRAGRIAHELLQRDVAAGSHVAVLSRNHPAFFEVWFGALRAGAVLLPVNFRFGRAEVQYVLQHAGAEVLFVSAEFQPLVAQLRPALPRLRHIVSIGETGAGHERYADWIAPGAKGPIHAESASSTAILIYTSGTTGQPKGAQLSHAALIADLHRYDTLGIWREQDVMLLAMPLIHLGGVGFGLRSLYRCAHMVVHSDFDAARVLESIERHRVTKMLLVPTMIRMLLESEECAGSDFASLDLITYGAAPMPPALLQRALHVFGCHFGTGYGLTESGGAVTYLAPEDHTPDRPQRLLSCGRASGAQIRIVDEAGAYQAAGAIGEVVIRSPQLMTGYLHAPAETAETIRHGWLHTGDAGYLDGDGYLYICDRIKDMIVSGGENIYPAEIEAALLDHWAIAEAAVIGVPDERWGEVPKALVVLRPGNAVAASEIQAFLRDRVAGYKVPRSVDFVGTLPRNASGKVLKRQLREPFWRSMKRLVN